jgi:hypothetical protein
LDGKGGWAIGKGVIKWLWVMVDGCTVQNGIYKGVSWNCAWYDLYNMRTRFKQSGVKVRKWKKRRAGNKNSFSLDIMQ